MDLQSSLHCYHLYPTRSMLIWYGFLSVIKNNYIDNFILVPIFIRSQDALVYYLVTLDLIATNVYNSVKAPTKRGFSYIEIWMIGVQIPILLGKHLFDLKVYSFFLKFDVFNII